MALINRDALLKAIDDLFMGALRGTMRPGGAICEIKRLEMLVKDAPTIDAVEVVRCKDCQAWGRSPYGHPTIGWCIVHGRHRAPDYFCASAKKRESVEVKVNG